jgi:hypothetical protein
MNENQDQPRPISVLEPPFEKDDNTILEASGSIKPGYRGKYLLFLGLLEKSLMHLPSS